MDSINFLNLEYLFLRIFDFLKNLDPVVILNAIIALIKLLLPVAIIITIFFVYVIFYSYRKLKDAKDEEERKFKALTLKQNDIDGAHDPVLRQKWLKIEAHINSLTPSDWRLAVIEADIMLNDILEKLGYQGDSIGEKLKGIKREDFLTLDLAWEAHKIRNVIAHKGSEFQMDEREAKRVIGLYRKVFEEFYSI